MFPQNSKRIEAVALTILSPRLNDDPEKIIEVMLIRARLFLDMY